MRQNTLFCRETEGNNLGTSHAQAVFPKHFIQQYINSGVETPYKEL